MKYVSEKYLSDDEMLKNIDSERLRIFNKWVRGCDQWGDEDEKNKCIIRVNKLKKQSMGTRCLRKDYKMAMKNFKNDLRVE